jgi:glycine betaine/proline transport system substrate-binding protein
MRTARTRSARLGVLAAVATLAFTACGGGSIDDETAAKWVEENPDKVEAWLS